MEHLAVALRNNTIIKDFTIGPVHTKLPLFADDLLMFVTKPHLSSPSIIQEFKEFVTMRNFKVNHSKSEILNISLSGAAIQHLSSSSPFKTGSMSIQYLGINIPAEASRLFPANFTSLLLKIKADLYSYATNQHLWLGKVNTLKMDVLPRFLYLFQTIPIYILTSYFRKLHRLISSFMWGVAHTRIKYESLSFPKAGGELQMLHGNQNCDILFHV